MFIIDFDDTLFDTQEFKQAMVKSLESVGVSRKLFWQTYIEARMLVDGSLSYSFERHARILEKQGFDYNEVLRNFNLINIKNFLFLDAIDFLESLKKMDQDLYLLSLGDEFFQKLKVGQCNIEKYFKKVFFLSKNKELAVKEILDENSDSNIFFINDKIEENLKIKNDFPEIEIILRQSSNIPDEEYKSSGIIYFQNLTEIKKYVTDKLK